MVDRRAAWERRKPTVVPVMAKAPPIVPNETEEVAALGVPSSRPRTSPTAVHAAVAPAAIANGVHVGGCFPGQMRLGR